MFAFFVVMFASSQVNKKRMERLSQVYSDYIEGEAPGTYGPEESPPTLATDTREMLTMAEMKPVKGRIEQRLSALLETEKIALELLPRGLVLSLREASFFDPGQETLRAGAKELLQPIGEALLEVPSQPIRLEGHTDDVPIHNDRFPSNWELSTARAEAVLDFMLERFPIAAGHMSVAGYGEHRPVEDNASPKGRAANRRVDIVILSQAAAEMAPKQRLDDPPTQPSQPQAGVGNETESAGWPARHDLPSLIPVNPTKAQVPGPHVVLLSLPLD